MIRAGVMMNLWSRQNVHSNFQFFRLICFRFYCQTKSANQAIKWFDARLSHAVDFRGGKVGLSNWPVGEMRYFLPCVTK